MTPQHNPTRLPRVLLYRPIADDLRQQLGTACRLTAVNSLAEALRPEYRPILSEVEGIIGVGDRVGADVLDQLPNLRVASTISVGYDTFDVDDLTRRGILLTHTPDILTETTADMIFLLILGVARRATEMLELVRQGKWTDRIPSSSYGYNVHGKTIGILGMGRIGYAVARRAHAGFGMNVIYYSRSQNERAERDFSARRCELDTVLKTADFVCLTLPLTEQTFHLIGSNELALMKPDAFLINGGRGANVDESALIDALHNGIIRGAGLDVYEQEPLPQTSLLLSMPSVFTLPHIGSATHETRRAMARCAVDNLLAALSGRALRNCVNPAAGSSRTTNGAPTLPRQ
jgi:gluconate 2-dehydrogenase